MDVRRPVAQRLADDPLHELDDGRLIVEVDVGDGLRGVTLLVLTGERGDERVDVRRRPVHLLDVRGDRLVVRGAPRELATDGGFDTLAASGRRVGGVDDERTVLRTDREHLVGACRALVDLADDVGVELDVRGLRDRHLTDAGDRVRHLVATDPVLLQQDVAELQQVLAAVGDRRLEPIGGQMPRLGEHHGDGRALLWRLPDLVLHRDGHSGRHAGFVRSRFAQCHGRSGSSGELSRCRRTRSSDGTVQEGRRSSTCRPRRHRQRRRWRERGRLCRSGGRRGRGRRCGRRSGWRR